MKRPGSSARRRSPLEWGVRGGLALLIACIGYGSVANTLAEVIREKDPERAHDLAPKNGRVAALLVERRFGEKLESANDGAIAALARDALRREPTAVEAVTTLGLQAQMRNDDAAARRVFGYSQRLSRRNLQTHLWLIEDAVKRGDVAGALQHYDMALRTSKKAPDLLFPVMAAALMEPEIQERLANIMAQRPIWGSYFVGYLADAHGDPFANARFFVRLKNVGVGLSEEEMTGGINGLIGQGAVEAAWHFYAQLRPGADPRRARDPSFSRELTTPSVFDWTPLNDGGVNASIQRDGGRGFFDFATAPGAGGLVLKQMQVLPVGHYRLDGHASGIHHSRQLAPYWTLTCQDGRILGRVEVAASGYQDGNFHGRFTVPAGCPSQTLSLIARSDDAGSSGQIDRVQLVPAS